MTNIFISYSDDRFKESQKRISRQAKKVGLFDKVFEYTPKDLPYYIKASPLYAFSKGGGYWVWKPYIIYYTLQQCHEGDVIYYCDAGCSLNKNSSEWRVFQEMIETHSAVFFQYRDGFHYKWGFNCDKTSIKFWMKPTTRAFFQQYLGEAFLDYSKIWAGFMIIKKTKPLLKIIDEWYKLTLFHPDLIIDPFGPEASDQPDYYHTHDQAILTPLVFFYHRDDNALVIPETAESQLGDPAVVGTRWMQGKVSVFQMLKSRLWTALHGE